MAQNLSDRKYMNSAFPCQENSSIITFDMRSERLKGVFPCICTGICIYGKICRGTKLAPVLFHKVNNPAGPEN